MRPSSQPTRHICIPAMNKSVSQSLQTARRSWCWVAARIELVKVLSLITAVCMRLLPCVKTVLKPSWSIATPKQCQPITTPVTVSILNPWPLKMFSKLWRKKSLSVWLFNTVDKPLWNWLWVLKRRAFLLLGQAQTWLTPLKTVSVFKSYCTNWACVSHPMPLLVLKKKRLCKRRYLDTPWWCVQAMYWAEEPWKLFMSSVTLSDICVKRWRSATIRLFYWTVFWMMLLNVMLTPFVMGTKSLLVVWWSTLSKRVFTVATLLVLCHLTPFPLNP